MGLRYAIATVLKAPFTWYYRYEMLHEDRIPKGGCVLAFNHSGRPDGFLLYCHFKREIIFLAKQELFDTIYRIPLSLFGHIAIDRGKGKSGPAIAKAVAIIKKGGAFGIFPEGTCRGAPRLRWFYTGAARVALTAHVPIIPVAIIGSYGMVHQGMKIIYTIPKKKKVKVIVGKPLYFSGLYGKENDPAITRKVMDQTRTAIRSLLIKYHAPKRYWGEETAKKPSKKF
ncbi:MAG: lysophospholipid acyltransferase family protein [archaeon]